MRNISSTRPLKLYYFIKVSTKEKLTYAYILLSFFEI